MIRSRELAIQVWDDVRAQIEAAPGSRVTLGLEGTPHPQEAGATRDLGLPVGQLDDWRFPPAGDCTGMHVHRFADRWVAHIDRVHPACSLVGHVRADAPQLLVGVGLALGAAVGARSGAVGCILGAVLGGLSGAALAK
jgi:hypothetical protein